eukprot:4768545-Pleurochrysis_carterae.AAC.2
MPGRAELSEARPTRREMGAKRPRPAESIAAAPAEASAALAQTEAHADQCNSQDARPSGPRKGMSPALKDVGASRQSKWCKSPDCSISARLPGRETQISSLLRLLQARLLLQAKEFTVPLFVHGPSGSGKSAVLRAVVDHLKLRTAVVDCLSCASPRLVYESALDQLHAHTPSAINGYAGWCTCETSAVFVAGLREALEEYGQVCIIFDHAAELLKARSPLLATCACSSASAGPSG